MTVVCNVIFDLGGVLLEWNPEDILSRFQPDVDARTRLRAAISGEVRMIKPEPQVFAHLLERFG